MHNVCVHRLELKCNNHPVFKSYKQSLLMHVSDEINRILYAILYNYLYVKCCKCLRVVYISRCTYTKPQKFLYLQNVPFFYSRKSNSNAKKKVTKRYLNVKLT